ncbi:hypothetical protein [Microbacterium aurugineum]
MSSIMLSKPHRQTLNGTSLDFQERMAELGVTAPTHEGATPCIVVATVRDDMEISALSLRLAARNIRLLRLNVDDLPDVDIVTYLDTLELIHGTEALRPVLFWARYLLHHPQRATAERGSEAGELLGPYVSQHNSAFIRAIEELSPHRVNEGASATGRLAQQRIAARSGLRVPETTVTRDISRGSRRVQAHDGSALIGKVVGEHWVEHPPGVLNGTFPRVLEPEVFRRLGVEPAPLIVQEFVPHAFELRVYAVGEDTISYRVDGKPSAEALWTDMNEVKVSATSLSSAHDSAIGQLIRELNIDFGALDFLVTEDDELVFLEVNLVGDWRYFEKAAGDSRVSDSVLNLIATKVQT